MKIEATTTFLHGRMRFEQGLSYQGEEGFAGWDALSEYWAKNGWAKEAEAGARCFTVGRHQLGSDAPVAVRSGDTLEIQNVHMILSAEAK